MLPAYRKTLRHARFSSLPAHDAILLKQSKEAVARLIAHDPTLERYPAIKARLAQFEQSVHLE